MGILALIASPVGKWVVGGVAIIGLGIGLRAHFIHQGQLEGQQSAQQAATAETEKQRATDRAQLAQKIADVDKVVDAANAHIQAADNQVQAAAQTIKVLVAQRQEAAQRVQVIPDAQLHADTVHVLGIRQSGDQAACYTSAEERAISNAVADDKSCRDILTQTDTQLQSLQDKIDGLNAKADAVHKKYDALAGYTAEVERDYTTLYNESRKGNTLLKIVTFGIGGRPKNIHVPDPAILFPKKAEAK